MTTFLIASMLSLSSLTDCSEPLAAANAAYALARQQTAETDAAVKHLRTSRTCFLAQADTVAAMRAHVQEIHLYQLAGARTVLQESMDAFFEAFTPAQELRHYTYVMRAQALLYLLRGEAPEAFAMLHRCLALTPPMWARERAQAHLRLAEAYRMVNQYAEAEQHLRAMRDVTDRHLVGAEKWTHQRIAAVAKAETLLQWYSLEDGPERRLREALAAAEEAFALRAYTNASSYVHVQHLLGEALTYTGDLDRADRTLRQAVTDGAGGDPFQHLMALYRLARSRLLAGDLDRSQEAFEKSLARATALGDQEWMRRIRHDQGRVELRAGNAERAKAHFRQAIASVEAVRAEIGTSEWAATSVSNWQGPYRSLARVLIEQDSLAAALNVMEQSRARHLAALQVRMNRLGSLDAAARSEADSLLTVLTDLRNRIERAEGVEAATHRAEAARVQSALDHLIGPPPSKAPLDLEALQRRLRRENRTVLYYVLDRNDLLFADEFATYVFVIQGDAITVKMLDLAPQDVAGRIAAIGPAVRGEAGASALGGFSLEALYQLYADLVAPVAAQVPPGTPLTIVPDGALFALPFAALVTEPVGRFAYGKATYLLDRHPLTIDLSLAPASPAVRGAVDLLAIGRGTFTDVGLEALPGARREVRAAAAAFGRSQTLFGGAATRPRFASAAPESHVIHFATHAVLHPTSPLYHALVLASPPGESALLHLHEIEGMRLDAELVTLSGCNTARGSLRAGEGMAGLQYAFRAVGARSTVSTLWSLSDEASVELFAAFYDHLAEGLTKDVALQRAQQAYRQKHPDASPFLWAAPVLYGSSAPLAVAAAPPIRSWWWLALAAGGFLAFLLWFKRRSSTAHARLPPL